MRSIRRVACKSSNPVCVKGCAEHSRRRGYGAEALLYSCRWAAENFDLPSILAITETENGPSCRTLERAAFVHDRDIIMEFQGSQERVSRYLWRRSIDSQRA